MSNVPETQTWRGGRKAKVGEPREQKPCYAGSGFACLRRVVVLLICNLSGFWDMGGELQVDDFNGAPGTTRTCGLLIRGMRPRVSQPLHFSQVVELL